MAVHSDIPVQRRDTTLFRLFQPYFQCLSTLAASLLLTAFTARAAAPAISLSVIPEQPAIFAPVQLILEATGSTARAPGEGQFHVEIRPDDPALRTLPAEKHPVTERLSNGKFRLIHNFRIAGTYQITAHFNGTDGQSATLSQTVQVQEQAGIGFWSETILKSILFVLAVLVLIIAIRRMTRHDDGTPS